jgi:hypothetical protein
VNIFEHLAHPTDREWLSLGLMCFGFWLWVFIPSLLISREAPRLLKKHPSQASLITSVFDLIAMKRFSFLGRLSYLIGLLWCFSTMGIAYLTDTPFDHLSFEIFLGVSFAYLAIDGLHVSANHKLIACLRILNELKEGPVEAHNFHEALEGDFIILVSGILMICVAAFLTSCWVFHFPMSFYALAVLANRS